MGYGYTPNEDAAGSAAAVVIYPLLMLVFGALKSARKGEKI